MAKPRPPRRPSPNDRMGWHSYYVQRFNKTGDKQAEVLAMWYLLLSLAFDESLT